MYNQVMESQPQTDLVAKLVSKVTREQQKLLAEVAALKVRY